MTGTPAARRVLIVEDDEVTAALLRRVLEAEGLVATVEADGLAAEQRLHDEHWDLLLADVELPGSSGLQLAALARECEPRPATLVITGHQRFEYAVDALNQGADGFLTKPIDLTELRAKVVELLALAETRARVPSRPIVLAIGAHPDDVEIGCGGALLRHVANGSRVVVLTLTGGEHGGDAQCRADEARAAAELMGVELIHLGLPDTTLSAGPDTIKAIEQVVSDVAPTVIYTHTLRDTHQDHRATHRATLVAARTVPNLLCYQAPSTAIDFTPTHFVDVSAFIETKLCALRAYASQHSIRHYLADDMILSTARYWSRFSGGEGFVEPMEVVRTSEGEASDALASRPVELVAA